MNDLGTLLGQWHQWRAGYSHERGFAQVRVPAGHDDDEGLEAMQLQSLEEAIAGLPQRYQLALQHVARYECLGVEVFRLNALPTDRVALAALCDEAQQALRLSESSQHRALIGHV